MLNVIQLYVKLKCNILILQFNAKLGRGQGQNRDTQKALFVLLYTILYTLLLSFFLGRGG